MISITSHRFMDGINGNTDNSLEAFRNVLKLSYVDELECDIQMTKDNIPVLVHDPNLKSISLIDSEKRNIRNYTFVELKNIPVQDIRGYYKGLYLRSFLFRYGGKERTIYSKKLKSGAFITKLEDVLNELPKNKRLLVEVKIPDITEKDLDIIAGVVNNYPDKDILFQGYNHEAILKLKKLTNRLSGALLGLPIKHAVKIYNCQNAEYVKKDEFDFYSAMWSLIAGSSLVYNSYGVNASETIIKENKGLRIWTMDSHMHFNIASKTIEMLTKRECILTQNNFGIITSFPFLYYEHIEKNQQKQKKSL
ncbi:MAG: glycerophosphodiester phosphodiesterase family protein [Bacilli bacterium]